MASVYLTPNNQDLQRTIIVEQKPDSAVSDMLQAPENVAPRVDETPELNAGQTAKTVCGLTYVTAFKLFVVVLLIVAIVLGLTMWDLDERIKSLLEWLEENKVKGIAIFIAIYAGLTGM